MGNNKLKHLRRKDRILKNNQNVIHCWRPPPFTIHQHFQNIVFWIIGLLYFIFDSCFNYFMPIASDDSGGNDDSEVDFSDEEIAGKKRKFGCSKYEQILCKGTRIFFHSNDKNPFTRGKWCVDCRKRWKLGHLFAKIKIDGTVWEELYSKDRKLVKQDERQFERQFSAWRSETLWRYGTKYGLRVMHEKTFPDETDYARDLDVKEEEFYNKNFVCKECGGEMFFSDKWGVDNTRQHKCNFPYTAGQPYSTSQNKWENKPWPFQQGAAVNRFPKNVDFSKIKLVYCTFTRWSGKSEDANDARKELLLANHQRRSSQIYLFDYLHSRPAGLNEDLYNIDRNSESLYYRKYHRNAQRDTSIFSNSITPSDIFQKTIYIVEDLILLCEHRDRITHLNEQKVWLCYVLRHITDLG
jgi:hypothetical protein